MFGVIFPAAVIGFELVTRLCAEHVFDPLPSPAAGLLVAAVPSANLALWLRLRRPEPSAHGAWVLAGAGAAAVAACYALVFTPVYPLALVGVLLFGLGLLPFGPLAACWVAVALTRKAARDLAPAQPRRALWACGGVAAGLLALALVDLPPAATRLALAWSARPDAEDQRRGVRLMRAAGDRDLLLRLCYDSAGRPSGVLSFLASGGGADAGAETARELYYRVTGQAFNAVAPPYDGGAWSFTRELNFDEDQGGAQVGGRLRHLRLASSRIDGSIAPADAAAYLEWTFEIRNTGGQPYEARFELQPPPGAVVTRATLWVNGEPREAVFAGRAAVRAAYQQVVVRERRDPLLVTAGPGGRVLVQAFPVPAGATMKFRLGFTAPLEGTGPETGRLILPAIVDRNFNVEDGLAHAVWLEADGPLAGDPGLFDPGAAGSGRLRGEVSDAALSRRPAVQARSPSGAAYAPAALQPVRALMLVVDGSAALRPHASALRRALDAVPAGARIGLVVAGDAPTVLPPAPWSPERRDAFERELRPRAFFGGQDNAGALARALGAAGPEGAVLWVHGPQPVRFAAGAARLEQTAERLGRPARLHSYAAAPGPDRTTPDGPWGWTARELPASGDLAHDVGDALHDLLRPGQGWRPRTDDPASFHEERLAHYGQVLALLRDGSAAGREQAAALAAGSALVTPVTGAVVLETDADYARTGLEPPDAAEVPTVPEPEEWALLALAATVLAWTLRRRRALAFA